MEKAMRTGCCITLFVQSAKFTFPSLFFQDQLQKLAAETGHPWALTLAKAHPMDCSSGEVLKVFLQSHRVWTVMELRLESGIRSLI